MKVDVKKKKEEALLRMRLIGLPEEAILQFAENETIAISGPPIGLLCTAEEQECEEVKTWEQKNNALVYHIIRNETPAGRLDSYLYVCDYEEDWAYEKGLLPSGRANAYVVNRNTPELSERGFIGICSVIGGGLIRIS